MQIKHQIGCVYKPGLNSVRVLLTEDSVTCLSTSNPTETSKTEKIHNQKDSIQ